MGSGYLCHFGLSCQEGEMPPRSWNLLLQLFKLGRGMTKQKQPKSLMGLGNLLGDSIRIRSWRQADHPKNVWMSPTVVRLFPDGTAFSICDLGRLCSESSNAHATHSSEGFGCLFVEEGSGCCCGHPWGQCEHTTTHHNQSTQAHYYPVMQHSYGSPLFGYGCFVSKLKTTIK